MIKQNKLSKLEIFKKSLKKIHQNKVDLIKLMLHSSPPLTIEKMAQLGLSKSQVARQADLEIKNILRLKKTLEQQIEKENITESCIHKLFKWLKK